MVIFQPIQPQSLRWYESKLDTPRTAIVKHYKMTRKGRSPSLQLWNARAYTHSWWSIPAHFQECLHTFQPIFRLTHIPAHFPVLPCVAHEVNMAQLM